MLAETFALSIVVKTSEALSLNHGDLLIMHPDCQKEWLHSVPTRKGITGQRINLTFRCYIRKK